jgi:hypothetical protein
MTKNTQMSNTAVNAEAAALVTLLANGYLRIYSGAQPSNANTAIGAQVLLSEHRLSATAAPAAVAGLITFNAITSSTVIPAGTTTATWARFLQSDGVTVVMDGTVDVAANTPNVTVNSTQFSQNVSVAINSATHQIALATAGL